MLPSDNRFRNYFQLPPQTYNSLLPFKGRVSDQLACFERPFSEPEGLRYAAMSSLGAVVTQAIAHRYGRDEFLKRLSHPFWFQSFGAVMGMDWYSSASRPALSMLSSAG